MNTRLKCILLRSKFIQEETQDKKDTWETQLTVKVANIREVDTNGDPTQEVDTNGDPTGVPANRTISVFREKFVIFDNTKYQLLTSSKCESIVGTKF